MRKTNTFELETFDKPNRLEIWNVCHWFEKEGVLYGTQKSKAKRFLYDNCIKKIDENNFKCLPIIGYNKTTHSLSHTLLNGWKCSCQFNRKNNKECSHIMACRLFIFMEGWNK